MNSVSGYVHDHKSQATAKLIHKLPKHTRLVRFVEIENKRELKLFNLIAGGCSDELNMTI